MSGWRRSPDVVIVGAGAIGCSVAYHLARRGCRNVLVVDRGPVGAGSSTRAAGGLRCQFSTEIHIRFSQLSLPFFEHAAEELGAPVPFDRVGYVILARSAQQAEAFRANVRLQRTLGVAAHWLTPAELATQWPFLRLDGVLAGAWCPDDALTDQVRFMHALGRRVRDLGVEIREGVEVRALHADGERVAGIETAEGVIEAERTVLAAGVWSPVLGATVGLTLPITPVAREVFRTGPVPELPDDMPFIADFDIGRSLRRDGDGCRLSGYARISPDRSAALDWAHAAASIEWLAEVVPALRGATATDGWAGLFEITPDHHALLGPAPGPPGLIVATGFSGHGLMHAPAAGLLVAELILDGRASTLDLTPLAPDRFERGDGLVETVASRYHEQGDVLVAARTRRSGD